MERWCVRCASKVVLNTDAACQEFRSHYANESSEKFVWIPNGTDPDFLDSTGEQATVVPAVVNAANLFCHPGSVYGNRCILPFIRSLEILKRRNVSAHFEQVGHIADKATVQREIARCELEDFVTLHDPRPHAELLSLMQNSSYFVIIQQQTSTQIPAKIFEMLTFRKPLLALTGEGATAELVREFNLGIVESSNDPERIADAAMELIQRHDEFVRCNGWERARTQFDGRALTGQLADTLNSMVGQR